MNWHMEPDTGARTWEPNQRQEVELSLSDGITVYGEVYTDAAGDLHVDAGSITIDGDPPLVWATERLIEKAVDDGE